jgi:dUTP pyrophosphatase
MTADAALGIIRIDPGIPLPQYESEGAAGLDIRAYLKAALVIMPMGREKIPTGLKLAIPQGFEGQIRPRSGLAFRHGITVLNAPGTIDSDYRGNLEIILVNLGSDPFKIENGDRIAQLVIAPVSKITVVEEKTLSETKRGEGGFGSTGI